MKYFTSDIHLAHPFVAALRGFIKPEFTGHTVQELRGFNKTLGYSWDDMVNVHDHDSTIIQNINDTVGPHDELYILGDLSSGGKPSRTQALHLIQTELNVPRENLHLILGNHENLRPGPSYKSSILTVFKDVAKRSDVMIDGLGMVALSHFQFAEHFTGVEQAYLSTNAQSAKYAKHAVHDDGKTILLHGHTHAKTPFEYDNPRELNIGMDAWGYKPVSEEQVASAFHNHQYK